MTNKDLFVLVANINANISNQETKVEKKLYKIYEKVKPLIDKYQAEVDDLKLEYASVDEKGNLIIDEKGGYKFTKDGLKEFNKAFRLLEDKEIEFTKIEVLNPSGLEEFNFLADWTNGITFNKQEEEEQL